MRLVLKPAGLLALVGVITALVAIVVSRVQGQRLEGAGELGPLAEFQSKKKASTEKTSVFDSKEKMAPVNLSETGRKDWIVWGLEGVKSPVRKANVTHLISDYSVLQPGKGILGEGKRGPSRAMFWKDGDPIVRQDVAYPGVHLSEGNGFRFTVPATKEKQTLRVYLGGYKTGGDIIPVLSNGKPVKTTREDVALEQGYYSKMVKIEFQAPEPNQQLTVIWRTSSAVGNISLQAATLE